MAEMRSKRAGQKGQRAVEKGRDREQRAEDRKPRKDGGLRERPPPWGIDPTWTKARKVVVINLA